MGEAAERGGDKILAEGTNEVWGGEVGGVGEVGKVGEVVVGRVGVGGAGVVAGEEGRGE